VVVGGFEHLPHYNNFDQKVGGLIFCLGTGVPRHRDGVVRPYVRTYVFSVLCSIFQ